MADYELNGQGQYINYMNGGGSDMALAANGYPNAVNNSLGLFLNGGTGADGKSYPKIDMSLWDQATMCATCHVGGVFYEQDRMGNRLPARLFADWGAAMTGTGIPSINPITTTVWESFDPATGAQTSQPTFAPWIMPMFVGNDPTKAPVMAALDSAGNPVGPSVPVDMSMPNPNYDPSNPAAGPQYYSLKKGQLLMPNVKEMDCLFCHFKGYDNVMASVMTQAGNLAMTPAVGAGLLDMTPISPTYQGYNGANVAIAGDGTVSLSGTAVANILAQPDSNNCMQCHATKTLKDFPQMFGTTGTANGFLSSAPMVYDPPGFGPLGKRMVNYDINSPFLFTGTSPVITGSNYASYMMTGLSYLQAMGASPFNGTAPQSPGFLGGGNMAQTGPLYYYNSANAADQNTLKRSTMPFPRAEWFKRGDAWQAGKDIHGSLGCAGCHYTGDSSHKNQCDPGRGFDMMSGIEDSVPPLKNRKLVTSGQGGFINYSGLQTPAKHDTRNTVKRCEFCHIPNADGSHTDMFGQAIDNFGAPDPTIAHQQYGLTANVVQIVDKMDVHGTFGGQGVSDNTDFTTAGKTTLGIGNHLDVMDCTVCHVGKQSMMVRTLDATSGMRFPSVLGTDPNKGMMGLFEDPAPDAFNAVYVDQMNQMYNAMYQTTGVTYIASGTHVVGGQLQPWKPLHTWQKSGNYGAPLNIAGVDPANTSNPVGKLSWRRKIYLSNPIVAAIWNNTDSAVDANGDGAPGGILDGSKPSLSGYKDVFSGDAPNKNNTQGYGEPIFDPWIMRDLKEGFNFGPSALSVISVGFNNPMTTTSGSAYDLSGNGKFAMGDYWKYASVWSGAVVFTEPYQIRDYKNFRTAIAAANKSWAGTELGLVADPFTVTHGIQPVTSYVLGKNCADCHAAGAGFFNGDYTMTGTAIPATRTYDPTAPLATTGATVNGTFVPAWTSDANSYLPVLDAYGDPMRMASMTGGAYASESNMMARPLEPYRVKAYKGDLRTNFEGFNKLGQPRTSEFQEDSACSATDSTICTHSVPLQRADALYPPESAAIYYKVGEVDPSTGATSATPMTGRDFANYLEGTGVTDNRFTMASLTALAQIDSVGGISVSAGTGNGVTTSVNTCVAASNCTSTDLNTIMGAVRVDLYAGDSVALVAHTAGNPSATTYSWSVNDGDLNGNGVAQTVTTTDPATGTTYTAVATRTIANPAAAVFNIPGIYKLTLTTTVAGITATDFQYISVTAKPVAVASTVVFDTANITTANTTTSIPVQSGSVPAGTNTIKIAWGDGGYSQLASLGATLTHNYARLAKYKVGSSYQYTTNIFYYGNTANGAVKLLASQSVPVTVTPLAQIVPSVRVTKLKSNGVYNVAKGSTTTIVLTITNRAADANTSPIVVSIPDATAAGLNLVSVGSPTVGSATSTTWTIPAGALLGKKFTTLALTVTVPMTASGNITYALPTSNVGTSSANDVVGLVPSLTIGFTPDSTSSVSAIIHPY